MAQEQRAFTQADLDSLEKKLSGLRLTHGEAWAFAALAGGELAQDEDVQAYGLTTEADVQPYIIVVGGKPVLRVLGGPDARLRTRLGGANLQRRVQ